MRKNLVVGILAETKNEWEKRAPLTPADVAWLVEREIHVEVQSSPLRIFKDIDYQCAGAKITPRFQKAKLLIGIKEPPVVSLIPHAVYMIFSHTAKGQTHNRRLLQAILKHKITLLDYEHMMALSGERIVTFGRYAGVCGMIDTLHVFGDLMKRRGIPNPFSQLKGAASYETFTRAKRDLKRIMASLHTDGLDSRLVPFVIGILGHGNVSKGAQEVLELLGAVTIHPRDLKDLLNRRRSRDKCVHKLIFQREEKLRSRTHKGFYFEEYLKNPDKFDSNMDQYLPHLNILINASYWDARYPRLVSEKMIRKLYKGKSFRLSMIGDLSCDIQGTVQITRRITTPNQPAFMYDPTTGKIHENLSGRGIAVMAIDNLPCEFPRESSVEFAAQIRDYVYQIAAHGILDITQHHALPREIREAVVAEEGMLTPRFKYLQKL